MRKEFLVTSLWELCFLYYVLYHFSYDISIFPWFENHPDRWGPSMIIFLMLSLFFPFCIPIHISNEIKDKKRRLKIYSILIFIGLFSFIYFDSFFSKIGYLAILIISMMKTIDLVKNISTFRTSVDK